MHYGHDHNHPPGPGHNHAPEPKRTVQWQTPHLNDAPEEHHHHGEPDVDLVEAAFVEGFTVASDPTSFLRLARVPFEAKDREGRRLVLLRVEVEAATDVGGVMPHLGGTSFRYDPLPAKMASRRRSLRFIYFDGQALAPLTLADVRGLAEA